MKRTKSHSYVRPKKALGQHFLIDGAVALKIVSALESRGSILEVGPGTGVLTEHLLKMEDTRLKLIEIDTESVSYLLERFPEISSGLYEADFLKMPLEKIFEGDFAVIGNFPYNISSQIFFKILDYRRNVPEVVCMIQREVAERLSAPPSSKIYGILSVLLQAWYDIEYLFTVSEEAFLPPPKVKSAVIRLTRNSRQSLDCDEALFKKIVKTSFNQRRKTIKNSLKPLFSELGRVPAEDFPFSQARPEQLSVEDFIELTRSLS